MCMRFYFLSDNWTPFPLLPSPQVLQLQNYLTNMEVPYTDNSGSQRNITLSDICFKPANNYCTIESVLNYFQNSLDNLNYTELFGLVNSSYHIHYCTRNPTATKSYYYHKSIPCLAQFGGFIDPNVALAGFQSEWTCVMVIHTWT